MQRGSVPLIGPRYWTGIALASVFGTNMGDFVSNVLHLGHLRGLPVLALAFAAILLCERRAKVGTEVFYWLAVVAVRTAATNFADLGTHDLAISYPVAIACLVVLLAAIVAGRPTLRPRAVPAGEGTQARPAADLPYWAAMLVAGTLGTALGDYVDDDLGIGTGPGSLLLLPVLAAVLAARRRLPAKAGYWCAIVAARTAGTAVGDFMAGRHGLALGLPLSTTITGAVFVGTLLLWQPERAAALQRA